MVDMLGEWLRRVLYLLNRRRRDAELRAEMEAHRELLGDHKRFGNMLRLREESADAWGWRWLDDVLHDLRYAVRTLRRTPGFTIITLASLALATGATTAIFSVVNSVLLRPLPFAEPEALVQIFGREWREDRGGARDPLRGPITSQELEAYSRTSATLDLSAGYATTMRLLQTPSGVERLTAVQADLEFFQVLGAGAVAGRTFRADDNLDVAVISYGLWERRFNKDAALPGSSINLDGRPVTVLGVMPGEFQFPYAAASLLPGALFESRTDVWVPLPPLRRGADGQMPRRGRVNVISRLKPGVTVEQAAAELRVIAARVEEQYRGTAIRVGVRVVPVAEVVLGSVRRSLWLLFAAVGLVLAAACANVANLLLARMTVRTREVVTRAALGASPGRLVRQFLAESLLLALAGGAIGALIARWGSSALVALGAWTIPRAHEIALDWRAFAFLFLVCLATSALFGVAPALAAARVEAHEVTKDAGGHATSGGRFVRLRDGLAVLEVAVAFVLAVGAAAIVAEVVRLRNVDAGMTTENVLTLHLTPRAPVSDYYAIEARVAQLPGVTAAGFTQVIPLQNWGWEGGFSVEGRPPDPTRRLQSELRFVTPGYFTALGIPVLQGRGFTASDTADAPRVVLVNEALAREYLPGESAVGIKLDRGTIVGVVGNVRHEGLGRPAQPEIFYAAAQNVAIVPDIGMSLIVRTSTRPETLTESVRAAVREVNPNLAIFNVKTMERVLSDSLWELNLYFALVGVFAALALALAAIGLYGVISYNVTSRMREFAVRLALGAEPAAVSRLVVSRAARLTGAGLAGGLLVALPLTFLNRSVPLGITTPLVAYAAISVILLMIAFAACLIPAFRVARVNPATALRHD
jgi:putative ABC transport system permease protein